MRVKQPGEPFDQAAYETCVATCVADIARKQAEAGVDVVSDGEFGKSISRSQYVLQRLSGFERRPIRTGGNPFTRGVDRGRFAEFYAELDEREGMATTAEAALIGPIVYTGQAELKRDIANFKAALKDVNFTEAFLPVACERHPGPQERVLQKRRGIDPGDRVGDAHRV